MAFSLVTWMEDSVMVIPNVVSHEADAQASSDAKKKKDVCSSDVQAESEKDANEEGGIFEALGFKMQVKSRPTGLFAFANTEEIKARVRAQKVKDLKNPYSVHDAYHKEGSFQWLAKHPMFENTTLGIIVVNALWISVDTDGNTADTMLDAEIVYIIADCLFFAYFSVELVVRFCAFKRKMDCLKDGWFKFDTTLVLLYAFDPFIIALITLVSGGEGLDLPTAVLRLFRLARLSRLVRMLRSLPELMVMIKGMVTAARSVGYTLGLLLLITYVFSIALRNLVPSGSYIEVTYFPSVLEAMHNLIIFGTFLDALSDFVLAIKEESAACLVLTWTYIALASLTVMNMLIGVLCEIIGYVAEDEKESMMFDKIHEKFHKVINEIDSNDDGSISWEEFKDIPAYKEALDALESVGVDAESMIDIAEDFLHDDEGNPVSVTFEEFMEMVLDLRGSQTATVKHVMTLGKRFTGKFQKVSHKVDDLGSKMDEVLMYLRKSKDDELTCCSRLVSPK